MITKAIPRESDLLISNHTFIDKKNEPITKTMSQIDKIVIENESKRNTLFQNKRICLKELDNYIDKFDKAAENYVKSLDSTFLNDIDILEKIYNIYYFNSYALDRIPLSDDDYKGSIDKFSCFLSLINSNNKTNTFIGKLTDTEVIKFIILKSPQSMWHFKLLSDEQKANLSLNEDWVLELFKSSFKTSNITQIWTPSILCNKIKDDKSFFHKTIGYNPEILRISNVKIDYEDLRIALKTAIRPFELMFNTQQDLKERILEDQELFLTMNKNCYGDEREKKAFKELCVYISQNNCFNQIFEDNLIKECLIYNPHVLQEALYTTTIFSVKKLNDFKTTKENSYISVESLKNKYEPYLPCLDWLDDTLYFKNICNVDPRILTNSEIRNFLSVNPEIFKEIFQNRSHFFIYYYDDIENIKKVGEKLPIDQLEKIIVQIKLMSSDEKEINPLYYKTVELSIKEILSNKKVRSRVGKDVFFHFQ